MQLKAEAPWAFVAGAGRGSIRNVFDGNIILPDIDNRNLLIFNSVRALPLRVQLAPSSWPHTIGMSYGAVAPHPAEQT